MPDPTPGQMHYEAFARALHSRVVVLWTTVLPVSQQAWETAAQAVLAWQAVQTKPLDLDPAVVAQRTEVLMTIEDIITFMHDEAQEQTLTHQDITRCVLLAFDLGVSTTHAVTRPAPFASTNDWLAGMGYTTYGMVTKRKNDQGLPMPTWDALPDPQKAAWLAATAAIRRRVVTWRLPAEQEDPDA